MAYDEILEKQEKRLREEFENEKLNTLQELEAKRIDNEGKLKTEIELLKVQQMILQCNNEMLESERENLILNQASTEELNVCVPTTESNEKEFFDRLNAIMTKPSKKLLHKVNLMVSYGRVIRLDYIDIIYSIYYY